MAVAVKGLSQIHRGRMVYSIVHRLSFLVANVVQGSQPQSGQDFGEYAVILALVVLAGAVAYTSFGGTLANYINDTIGAVIAIF